MSGYKYDVFISYSRRGSVQKWLLNHFYDKLVDCLADELAPAPKVYIDKGMPRGVHWPSELEYALRHSKIIMPLLSAQYFESAWCMAEWRSMRERQKVLRLANPARPQTLIYPILYADSDNFPAESREYSWIDLKEFGNPELAFQQTPAYSEFHRRVSRMAADLVELLQQVPEWQPDWPTVTRPDPVILPPPPIPRFDR